MPPELPNDRERLRELLGQALDLAPEDQRAFLERHLGVGPALDDALELLDQAKDLGSFLEAPVTAQPTFEPALPERIGSYRVRRVLGWGSMGVVYLAEQEAPQRKVALKVLRLDACSESAARRFTLEGELLGRLSHPGIAGIIEAGWADLGAGRQPFLVMEYVDGEPITTHAESQGLDRGERIALLRRVAESVAYAHEQRILHRDLKPENVLVSRDGQPTVLDFGVAMVTEEADLLTLTVTGQIVGTLAYMAPEQARGNRLDGRADQFALGAMLHELLTGELPFDVRGKLPHEALRIVADADWRPPTRHDERLTPDIEAVLATALAPEPVRRYPNMTAFVEDLRRLEAGQPVRARAPGGYETLRRFVARHRRFSALAAVSLFLMGALLAFGLATLFNLQEQETLAQTFVDRALLRDLELEAERLWPGAAPGVVGFDDWVARAESLLARLPFHRAALVGLLPSTKDDWIRAAGEELVADLERFSKGLAPDMRARRDRARSLAEPFTAEHAQAWREAAARVAADPRFPGLALAPQHGLLPIGADPDSGLEEFAVHGTGEPPTRDDEGRFRALARHAIVLVLVPGQDAWIGGQQTDPDGPNYAPGAPLQTHEGPPVRMTVEPFLLSKFELTQAQWVRCFGRNPSDWEVGSEILGITIDPLHPVESLSWDLARQCLPRLGLDLPTEAQWEVAARGGGAPAYLGGQEPSDLAGFAHFREEKPRPGDGCHRPVGQGRPNGYGLYDVLGNVWELCLDDYKVHYHRLDHRSGTGQVIAEPDGDVSRRGAGAGEQAAACYLYRRQMRLHGQSDSLTGVRPARGLSLDEMGSNLSVPRVSAGIPGGSEDRPR